MSTMAHRIIGTLLLSSLGFPVMAAEAASEGSAFRENSAYFHMPGADQPGTEEWKAAVQSARPAGNSHHFIAGSAFSPRSSSQTVSYGTAGCTYSNAAVTTDLQLPEASQVLGVRVFYRNLSAGENVRMFLTTYDGLGATTDLLTATTTEHAGYASEYFELNPAAAVDNYEQAYVLTATMNVNTRMCGMRVFYAAP